MSDEQESTGRPIAVGEAKYVCWDVDHERTQGHFLSSLDPSFFEYTCTIHQGLLDGDQAQHAAVALRVTYSHVLESLFAILGATLQAPHCPAGWMLRYKNADLMTLVKNITGHAPYINQHSLKSRGWDEVARALTPCHDPAPKLEDHMLATGYLLGSLARDFIDVGFEAEYNSLKHGFRVKSGGSYLALGVEDTPGVPARPERMRMFAQSDFGSTFLVAQKLKDRQFTFGSTSLHWNPHFLARRIPLAVRCMENVIGYLKFLNDLSKAEFSIIPLATEEVDEALAMPSRSFRWTWNGQVSADDVPDLSADDILSRYKPVTFRPVLSSDGS